MGFLGYTTMSTTVVGKKGSVIAIKRVKYQQYITDPSGRDFVITRTRTVKSIETNLHGHIILNFSKKVFLPLDNCEVIKFKLF
jgi:hypothetical protein